MTETDTFEPIGDAAQRVVEKIAAHKPGVYFGLDEAEYHADPALGSSSKKALLGDVASFWWYSPLNPTREEREPTAAQALGTAVHKYVLEGPIAFERCYGRCLHKGNVKAGIEERKALAAEGKIALASKDFDRVVLAASMVRLNPNVAEAFTGGLPEVSVFWETDVDGEIVRQKARFDYLKPRAVVDLKTITPLRDASFEASCHRAIRLYRYDIQAQSYLSARALVPDFVADGAVYGDHDPAWLAKIAAAQDYAFVFCFWASEGPPLTWGGVFSPGNRRLVEAQVDIDRALWRYVDCRREFGEDAAWIRPAPLQEIDPDNIDNWYRLTAA